MQQSGTLPSCIHGLLPEWAVNISSAWQNISKSNYRRFEQVGPGWLTGSERCLATAAEAVGVGGVGVGVVGRGEGELWSL